MENLKQRFLKPMTKKLTIHLELEVRPQTWELCNDFGKKIGLFKQIPFKNSICLTIHSCQGSTLDSAEVDYLIHLNMDKLHCIITNKRFKQFGY